MVPGIAAYSYSDQPRTRLLEREALGGLQVGRNPVDHAVAHEVAEGVRDRDGPEITVRRHVLEKRSAGTRASARARANPGGKSFLYCSAGRPRDCGVSSSRNHDDGDERSDERVEVELRAPVVEQQDADEREIRDQRAADVVRDVPRRDGESALFRAEPVHHRLAAGGQPMPWTQPLTAWITTIVTSVACAASNRPKAAMIPLESSRPSGRKYFGLLRSRPSPSGTSKHRTQSTARSARCRAPPSCTPDAPAAGPGSRAPGCCGPGSSPRSRQRCRRTPGGAAAVARIDVPGRQRLCERRGSEPPDHRAGQPSARRCPAPRARTAEGRVDR